jgi:hypothetical protein
VNEIGPDPSGLVFSVDRNGDLDPDYSYEDGMQDDYPYDDPHQTPLAACPERSLVQNCRCPDVQSIRVGNLPVLICACCGGVPR